MEKTSSRLVAMLPSPGMGHLIPLAELAKRLVADHGFFVTLITFSEGSSQTQKAFLNALRKEFSFIDSVELPPIDLTDLPADARIETHVSVAAARSVPAIRNVLQILSRTSAANLVAFVADLFTADTFDAAREAGVSPYLFLPSSLHSLSLMLHLPKLDAEITCEFRDLSAPVELPGCVAFNGIDLLHPLQDRSNECYRWMVHHGEKYREAEGILVNTFDDFEPGVAKAIKAFKIPIYTIGPLVRNRNDDDDDVFGRSEILEWLDQQPEGSVLFVSFGSGGTLTTEQTKELALGLEMSGQRFLWVVRSPSDGDPGANYLNSISGRDPLSFLPEGFLERTKDVGLVVLSWAPQAAVLAHAATGGFLSHCGWNSTLESVVSGVGMIAWPLFAEQRMNAVLLTEGVGVALRPAVKKDGVYGREEISDVVKELMEGKEGKRVRAKATKLKEAAAAALSSGGKSSAALAQVANKWKTSVNGDVKSTAFEITTLFMV